MRAVFFALIVSLLHSRITILSDIKKTTDLAAKYNKPICLLSGADKKILTDIVEKKEFMTLLENRCLFAYSDKDSALKVELLGAKGEFVSSLDISLTNLDTLPFKLKQGIQKYYMRNV